MTEGEVIIACAGPLTSREAEAVLWVALGKTSWEAGQILGVSQRTIDAHVVHAAEKLGASNRAHLVARAFVRGVLAVGTQAVLALALWTACARGGVDTARRPPRPLRCRRREDAQLVVAGAA